MKSVVGDKGTASLINMIGFNFRMTEIEASMASEQLKKLDRLVAKRLTNVEYLAKRLSDIPCLSVAKTRPYATHVYYVHILNYDAGAAGVHRNRFIEAVRAELMPATLRETEGVKIGCGYVKPLYLLPLFQERTGYGNKGCPWTCGLYGGNVQYDKGMCPVAENLHFETLISHDLMYPGMSRQDLDDVANAFEKVWENRRELL